jgi:Dyp-type peroxidase family
MEALTPAQFFDEVRTLNLHAPVNRTSPVWREAANLLQGNIAKAHGRDYTALILIQIDRQRDSRRKLKNLALRCVTTAKEQDEQAEKYRKEKSLGSVDQQLLGNLYLSVWGYQALGYLAAELSNSFPDPEGIAGATNWFLSGMEYQGPVLADPPSFTWESPYRENRLDAMLLLASDDAAVLSKEVDAAVAEIVTFGSVVQVEMGVTLRDKNSRAIEHFGFVDGISQLGIFNDSRQPSLPRHLLVPDVLAREENAFGTYVVYRKLEQDVKGFTAAVEELAKTLQVSIEHAEALVMGRFKDGTPVTQSNVPTGQPMPDPGFQGDLEGAKCPFHAHIRKVNPRVWPNGNPISVPLFRRGIPYGSYVRDFRQGPPSEGVGLLFLAFQADIARQFGLITREWVNSGNFLGKESGTDVLMGTPSSRARKWPVNGETKECAFSRFVRLMGGEFFFAPSFAFFRNLI